MTTAKILVGNVKQSLPTLPKQSVQTIITSPPYWGLRDYGMDQQIGLEETPKQFVDSLVDVFRLAWDVLKDDGTLWLNLGDSYAGNSSRASNNGRAGYGSKREGVFTKTGDGIKPKDLVGIPWRVAFALQEDGWYLRQDIIWHKPNPMPESVTDRCTKSHEYVFLLSKRPQYFFNHDAISEESTTTPNVRNKRDVWTISTQSFVGAHFAVMPEALVEPCILAGSKAGDVVLDPFAGSGTVGLVALRNDRTFVGCELNPEYAAIAKERIGPLFTHVEPVLPV